MHTVPSSGAGGNVGQHNVVSESEDLTTPFSSASADITIKQKSVDREHQSELRQRAPRICYGQRGSG